MKSPFPLILGCNRQNIRPIQKLFSRSSYATSTTYQPHSYDISRIRNIGISAHIDSGKTTLTERILFYTGRIHTIHEVRGRDGVGAKMDSMELEREKGITIQSAATYAWWRGEWQINLIDTPGHVDFTIEVERALRVLDAAVMVVCAVSGVQSQTITVDRQMKRYNIPRLGFINKLDRAGAAPWKCIEKIRGKLGIRCAALQVPLALEDSVEEEGGPLVDLVQMKGWKFDGEHGERMIPFELQSQDSKTMQLIRDKRRELIETLADIDEPLFNAYLENEDYVTTTLLRQAIRRTTLSRQFMPIFMGSAYKNSGVQLLLDGVADYLPNPYEVENWALDKHNERHLLSSDPTNSLVCLAFKLEDGKYGQLTYIRVYQGSLTKGSIVLNARTGKRLKVPRLVRMHSSEMEDVDVLKAGEIGAMFGVECSSGDTFTDGTLELSMTPMHVPDPVISLAVNPVSLTQDGPAFAKALQKFQKEDPTLRVHLDTESNQTIISGMGELHLEIYLERMRREYRCNCIIGKPQVAYRETITRKASFDYQHKKQTGGAGQYARVIGYIEPVTLLTDTPDIQPKQILSEDSNGNQFVNQVYGGTVPTCYIPACDKVCTLKRALICNLCG